MEQFAEMHNERCAAMIPIGSPLAPDAASMRLTNSEARFLLSVYDRQRTRITRIATEICGTRGDPSAKPGKKSGPNSRAKRGGAKHDIAVNSVVRVRFTVRFFSRCLFRVVTAMAWLRIRYVVPAAACVPFQTCTAMHSSSGLCAQLPEASKLSHPFTSIRGNVLTC